MNPTRISPDPPPGTSSAETEGTDSVSHIRVYTLVLVLSYMSSRSALVCDSSGEGVPQLRWGDVFDSVDRVVCILHPLEEDGIERLL